MIIGDYETLLGIANPWTTDEEKNSARIKGIILLSVFMICSIILIASIILTIKTNPGGIPDDKEWDM